MPREARIRVVAGKAAALVATALLVAVVAPEPGRTANPRETVFASHYYGDTEAAQSWSPHGNFQAQGDTRASWARPTVTDPAAYLAEKARLAREPRGVKSGAGGGLGKAPTGILAAPGTTSLNVEGSFQAEQGSLDLRPSDNNGAVGPNHYIEVTNSSLDIFAKTNGALLQHFTLNSFFAYTGPFLFDPRVVYDPIWKRWVVVADSHHESTGVQGFFLAVSTGSDPTVANAWLKYPRIDIDINDTDEFFDYPQLGFTQDALIVTGNVFQSDTSETFRRSIVWPMAKARVYNGLSIPIRLLPITGVQARTIAPPIVAYGDQNRYGYLLSALYGTSSIQLYRGQDLSSSFPTVALQANIAVPAYTFARAAKQPGTDVTLATSDARFESPGTQIGNSLWNVHTIDNGGFPSPKFYQINTITSTVVQSGFFFRSLSSDDFNASIAVNTINEAFVTWTATDPSLNVNAEVRFSGRLSTDPAGSMNGPGTALFTSASAYTDGMASGVARWGDYSSTTIDWQTYATATGSCGFGRRAWIVNQKNNSATVWGSRIGRVGFC